MDITQYASAFPGLSDEDFVAAGFSPDEVYAYRVNQQAASETSQAYDLASIQEARRRRGEALAAQYPDYFTQGLEVEPSYGIDQRIADISAGAQLTQDPNFARRQFARLSTDLGLPLSLTESVLGLAELTPYGSFASGYDAASAIPQTAEYIRSGEYGKAALTAAGGGLAALDAAALALPISVPVARAVSNVDTGKLAADVVGTGRALADMDLEFLRGRGNPAMSQPAGAEVTGRPPLTFDDVESAMRAAPEPVAPPMIVQHNLSSQNLDVVESLGGIPMPSIAIARADQPLQEFGDISLLLNPEKVAPRRGLSVWPADAYTGRQPKADIDFADPSAAYKAMQADPQIGHFNDIGYWMDATAGFADADRILKTVEYGIENKISNPKDFNSIFDYARDVQRKVGVRFYEEDVLNDMTGLTKYGDITYTLAPEDAYTPSGMRRKPSDYSIQNVYKRMEKEKAYKAGTEQGGFGAGRMRALLMDEFKSLEDIKKNRGLLVSEEEMTDIKYQWNSRVDDAAEDMAAKFFNGSDRKAMDYLEDIASGNSVSWANAPKEAADEARRLLSELKEEAKSLTTHYFEVKPRSVAELRDFDAAIVPESDLKSQEILRKNGIKNIVTYKTPEERRALFKKFPELTFSTAAGGISVGSLMQGKETEQ